jgi:hypothetical protein
MSLITGVDPGAVSGDAPVFDGTSIHLKKTRLTLSVLFSSLLSSRRNMRVVVEAFFCDTSKYIMGG